MKVKELLSDETRWIKHSWAKDVNKQECHTTDPDACSFCLLGAISLCYSTEKKNTKS